MGGGAPPLTVCQIVPQACHPPVPPPPEAYPPGVAIQEVSVEFDKAKIWLVGAHAGVLTVKLIRDAGPPVSVPALGPVSAVTSTYATVKELVGWRHSLPDGHYVEAVATWAIQERGTVTDTRPVDFVIGPPQCPTPLVSVANGSVQYNYGSCPTRWLSNRSTGA